eukprot:6249-Pelagococcus_subviridis.AAC.1
MTFTTRTRSYGDQCIERTSACVFPWLTPNTAFRRLIDGATVDTRSGSALLSWPIGSALRGALGPAPILKMDTLPNSNVCECGERSPRGP